MSIRHVTYRHWLPIITFCPVNKLPDPLYISLTFDDSKHRDLYKIRRAIREGVRFKLMYMEDIAATLSKEFPEAKSVRVSLLFNRHVVEIHH